MQVQDILQSKGADVFTVTPSSTIKQAVEVLGSKNIGAVVVKDDDGKIAGILSERDVVRVMQKQAGDVMSVTVSSCMTPNPYVCALETTVNDLMAQMTDKRIRHMPVVQNGALVGMISIGDVVKRKIEQSEQEAAALKEYIAS